MREIVKLQEAIEQERCRLNSMIENGMYDDDDFYEANKRMDRLIERYIELEKQEDMPLARQSL